MPYGSTRPLHHAALAAAERGWHVFPLVPGAKRPAVAAWEQRATLDRTRITRCWSSGAYNLGIATGPSRLVVLDLDVPKNDDTPPPGAPAGVVDGADMLAVLAEQHDQPIPTQTYTVRTASGGTHLYFTAPVDAPLRNTAGKLGWKIDSRAGGGYVVGAESTIGRERYTILHDAPPAPLPDWLTELLTPAPLPPQRPVPLPELGPRRLSAYLRGAMEGEWQRVTDAPVGTRNTALYRAAVALGQLVAGGELAAADVTALLASAAVSVGLDERAAHRTIASGLRAGAHRPRTVARRAAA
ncbi:bifunctional DNA primase/polymerase [Streptomyces sp. WMMC500]|uniref:bifunctional DNA primase/polymerase n=1 Tax=Streptomyces sp. WMMC500 TaxID=3015154 RepID=UPI00248C05D9|nr:bifunctional DNA primase/polymerase [Streptomyces sp. WMMC500]WBB59165.1 bifunctional DNA primase/polymerase [Streptomyces sp. WMMC500]